MPIITLTTDMGTSGYYVGSVKAAILSRFPEATIVDITHHVRPFHVSSAAFILRNVYGQFPKGTVHIASVDSLNTNNPRFLALAADGHYFVGADNGLFSLALSKQPDKVVEITPPADSAFATFPARDVFAVVACQLAKGTELGTIGADCPNYMRPTAWQPTHDANSITAVVVYIDEYGNCICNLDESLFQFVGKGRSFILDIKRYVVDNISSTYSDGPPGEIVALFSSSGLLELAQNHGNLAELIGIKDGDMIKISFA